MSSITVTLTGKTSSLSSCFYPEIELDEKFNYSCSLLDFHTYNSVPNINEGNNKLAYTMNGVQRELIIPIGSYEIDDLVEYINTFFMAENVNFVLRGNKNTLKCSFNCDRVVTINFSKANSVCSVLGFDAKDISDSTFKEAERPVNIQNINTIRIDCDLTSGSFHNGNSTHTIYEFTPSVNPGYKIIEQPNNLIYLPLVRKRISTVSVRVVDQNGELIDFRGENITCRIHIKRDL